MRKIEKNEWIKTSKVFANIFNDYDLYDLCFKRNKLFEKRIYYFFCIEICGGINYTYEFDDFKALATIKKPGDIDGDEYSCFNDLFYSLGFVTHISRKALNTAKKYVSYAKEVSNKYYNPETDCYVKNIGVIKECRGKGYLKRMFNEICGDLPIYLETHDANNVKIYEKLGFKLLETSDFMGMKHYAMKKF